MPQFILLKTLRDDMYKLKKIITQPMYVRIFLLGTLFLTGLAQAATYTLPADIGSSPFNNCSFSSGTTYNCTGNITIGTNHTINVTTSMTLNLTSGDFKVGNNLTINSSGYLFTISAQNGDIDIGKGFTGSVNLQAGKDIKIDDNATITGNLSASDNIEFGKDAVITGNLTAGNDIKIDKNANITGNLNAADDIQIDKDSNITGNLTAGDSLDLGNNTNVIGNCSPSHPQCTPVTPPLAAEYRFEENIWTGASKEIIDSINANNMTRIINVGSTTTTNTGNPPQTIASEHPSVNGGFCKAAFFDGNAYLNTSGPPSALQSATETSIAAWIYPTSYPSSGLMSIASNDVRGEFHLTTTGKLNFWTSYSDLTSNASVPLNQWSHVAVTYKAKEQRIYINGVLDITGTVNSNLPNTNICPFWVGSDGGGNDCAMIPARNFKGWIDEVWLSPVAATQSQINAVRTNGRLCASGPDHIRIEHDGSALTCTAETITVKACANATCSSLYTAGTVTGNITWAGAPGGSIPFTITGGGTGQTTISLPVTTVQTVTLGTSAVSPAPINSSQCLNTTTSTNSCAINFSASGFVVTIPNHVSCMNAAVTIEAVQQGTPANRCVPAFANVTRPVNLFTSYVSPATGTLAATASTGAVSTSSPGTTHNLAFDATGKATITLSYPDAGQLTLTANGTAPTGAAMTGNATFIVAPASFTFSGIPAAPLKAGQSFNATVTAKNACATPATTPNFTGKIITVTSSNPQPGLGNATAINSTITTTGGSGSTNLSWNEVGTIDLTAIHSNYLGSAFSISGTQAGVGRFQPAYFDTVVTPGCNAFTYAGSITPAKVGQPFTVTTTAKAVGGNITRNYAGSTHAYSTTLSNAGVVTGFSNNTLAGTDFINGIGTRNNVTYATSIAKTAPLTITLRAINSDTPAVSSAGFTEGATVIRSGRLMLQNAYGSELLDLPIPLEAQYWNGTAYILNQLDNCSTIPIGSIAMGNYKNSLNACETLVGYSTGSGLFVNGASSNLRLTKPGAGNQGSVDLSINLNAASGNTCTSAAQSLASNANLPWLGANPAARATFGIYKTPIIYMRENY